MKVLLHTFGSYGDVHPFIGLGLRLLQRGHDVVLVTNEHFAPLAEKVGVPFVSAISAEAYHQAVHSPDFWHPRKGVPLLIHQGVVPTMHAAYPILRDLVEPSRTVVIGSSFGWAARLLMEREGVPGATVHLSPTFFRSIEKMPRNFRTRIPQRLPRFLRPLWWRVGDLAMDRVMLPGLNAFRNKLGLVPVSRVMNNWIHAPERVLAMFPNWFAPPPTDWPKQVRYLGFPLYDREDQGQLPGELESFLDAGSPPIAFTPGTAMGWGHAFFARSVAACEKLGRRGLLLTRYPEQIPSNLPKSVLHVPYAPFSLLLPRVAALVHHGGIGTTAQALKAGVPQLIRPQAFDQFDNVDRAAALGVAFEIDEGQYTVDKATTALAKLLSVAKIRAACAEISTRFEGTNPLHAACDEIEDLLPYRARTSA